MMTNGYIELDHGSGGIASNELISSMIIGRLDNEFLRLMEDSAVMDLPGTRIAFTTDSYVVDPIFFPGGDIGSLAVHGTVNDLSMRGAIPRYLTLSLILEEGLPMDHLKRIIDSAADAAGHAEVIVVAGDTKVVPRGHADKIFINTSGIGIVPPGISVSTHDARPGDVIMVNGNIGDHGMAILACREGLSFTSPIKSDSAPLNSLVSTLLKAAPNSVHCLRDPTRGGVATALNEIAINSGVTALIEEDCLPFTASVKSASEMLGLDPLYAANEGKVLVFASADEAPQILTAMKGHRLGKAAQIIGRVTARSAAPVFIKTRVGGTRILPMLTGEQLPRIC